MVRHRLKVLDKLASASDRAVIYHGSPFKIEGGPTPQKHPLTGDKPVVFGTPNRGVALAFMGKRWTDADFDLGSVNRGPLTLTELRKGALRDTFKGQKGYLYTLDSKSFSSEPGLWSAERVSSSKPTVLKVERIDDVYAELAASGDIIVKTAPGNNPKKQGTTVKAHTRNLGKGRSIRVKAHTRKKKAVLEKLAANRAMRELAKRLGVVPGKNITENVAKKYVSLPRKEREELRDLAKAAGIGLGRDYSSALRAHRHEQIYGWGIRDIKTGEQVAQYEKRLKRRFSGGHKPKKGEIVVPATGDAELSRNRSPRKRTPLSPNPREIALYRGNPIHKFLDQPKRPALATPHPDVAAGYAMGDASLGQRTDATGFLYSFVPESRPVLHRADAYSGHGGPSAMLNPSKRKELLKLPPHVRDRLAKKGVPLKKSIDRRISQNNPTYETVIGPEYVTYETSHLKKLPKMKEYKVRRTRMPDGSPAYALSYRE